MTYRRKTAQEIKAAVQELSQEAKNKVEEYAQDSEGIRAYLTFMSKLFFILDNIVEILMPDHFHVEA